MTLVYNNTKYQFLSWCYNWVQFTYLTYFREQSPSWEADWFLASQEIPCILWNPMVYYHIQKCLPPVPTLSHINLVHVLPFHLLKIHFNITLLSTPGSFKWYFPLRLLHQNSVCTSPLPTCYMPHPSILLNLITPIIFGNKYKSLSPSLCSFLHSPVILTLLGPNIPLTSYSPTPSVYVPPSMWAAKFHTHAKQQAKL